MLLVQPKRFQFNKSYVYGSAAFVAGFTGILAILIHFAPIRITQADVVKMDDPQTTQQASTETKPTTQSVGDEQGVITTPTNATSRANSSATTPAVNNGNGATAPTTPVETPATSETPTESEVPVVEVPTDPTDPTTPIIPDPIPELPIDIPSVETPLVDLSIDIL